MRLSGIAHPSTVRQIAVPQTARALSLLPRIDYADAFLVESDRVRERTAEQWARTILEDAPVSVRSTLHAGWAALGLKLGEAPPELSVLGWQMRRRTTDLVLLGAGSRIGMPGELLFKRRRRTLLFATFVHYDNHRARAVWAGVKTVHLSMVRRVLEQGARR